MTTRTGHTPSFFRPLPPPHPLRGRIQRGKRRSAACGGSSKPLSRQRPVQRTRMWPLNGWRNEGQCRSAASGGSSKPLSRQRPVQRTRMWPLNGWRNEGQCRSAACGGNSKPLSRQRPVQRTRMWPLNGAQRGPSTKSLSPSGAFAYFCRPGQKCLAPGGAKHLFPSSPSKNLKIM